MVVWRVVVIKGVFFVIFYVVSRRGVLVLLECLFGLVFLFRSVWILLEFLVMMVVVRGVNFVLGFRIGGFIGGKGYLKIVNLWL